MDLKDKIVGLALAALIALVVTISCCWFIIF